MHAYARICMQAGRQAGRQAEAGICMHMHAYAGICMHMHAYGCIYTHMRPYACICVHAGICMHIMLCMHMPGCSVTNEAPRAATELSFGGSGTKFRVVSRGGGPEARFALFLCFFVKAVVL